MLVLFCFIWNVVSALQPLGLGMPIRTHYAMLCFPCPSGTAQNHVLALPRSPSLPPLLLRGFFFWKSLMFNFWSSVSILLAMLLSGVFCWFGRPPKRASAFPVHTDQMSRPPPRPPKWTNSASSRSGPRWSRTAASATSAASSRGYP